MKIMKIPQNIKKYVNWILQNIINYNHNHEKIIKNI